MKPQVQMIVEMVKAVASANQIPMEEAYDLVLTWIGVQVHVEDQLGTEGIQVEAYHKLYELFDLKALQSESWDWLGEAAEVLGVLTGLPSKAQVELKANMVTVGKKPSTGMPESILVQNTWTGRDLFALHSLLGEGAIYFGTEQNLRLYRTAVLNTCIHNIPAQILYVDNTVDTNLSSQNWRCANLWNPVKFSKLKPA